MPKMKTHKGAKARFKITARGKLLRTRPGRRHILTKKRSKRKRHLRTRGLVHETLKRIYLRMLGKA